MRDPHGYNPDHAQPIPIGKYGKQPATPQLPLTWKEALRLFFLDNRKQLLMRLAARYVPAVLVGIGVVEDFAFPPLGFVEEPVTIGFLLWCIWRINKYRKTGK